MNYKIGFLIKPDLILENNEVTFIRSSDGKLATYTESDCLAYGFIYNDSKCWSIQNSTSFLPPDNQNILLAGANNVIGVQSSDCTIIGINNELRFNDKNSLIVGERNIINDDVNNTIVSGTKADANYKNSIVLGANQIDDILGERQTTLVLAGVDTTSAAWTISYINDDGATLFNVKDNTVISFSAFVTGVRVGGTAAGNNGDFKSWIERGTVVTRGTAATISRTRQNIGTNGTTTGWSTQSDVSSDNNLRIKVKGATNYNIKWIIRIEISELRTGLDLS